MEEKAKKGIDSEAPQLGHRTKKRVHAHTLDFCVEILFSGRCLRLQVLTSWKEKASLGGFEAIPVMPCEAVDRTRIE
jgi:hypothetical protein